MTPVRRWGDIVPGLLAAGMTVTAACWLGIGLWLAWARNYDGDMQERVVEYASFRLGDYPNRVVDEPVAGPASRFTVYPPYAFPMFAAFFEPGGLVQGRVLLALLSVAAVVLMGCYGHERLKRFGPGWAAVGALAGAGMASNGTSLALGQFSTLCAGLLVLQIMLLERGRAADAGLAWAGAMIKPHVGIAFVILFLVNRRIVGLVCGLALLAGLSGVALWWTETSAAALVHHWLFQMQMKFTAESAGVGPGHLALWLGLEHRVAQYVPLLVLACLSLSALAIARLGRRDIAVPDLLPLAGMGAVLGRVLTYHRHYDDVMLFPLLLAWLSIALATPTAANIATAAAVGLTLWIPHRLQELVPLIGFIQPAIWIVAGLRLAGVAVNTSADPAAGGPPPADGDATRGLH